MQYPSVAVVILNYNGRHHLQQFLPSVLQSTYSNLRIIVADNASTDDSVSFLYQNFPSAEVITNDCNYGFAEGYNVALKKVQADYYVLLNSDVEVTPDWIAPVIELMETNVSIAAAQPKILAYQKKNYFEYAGAAGGWLDCLGYPFSRGRIFDTIEKDQAQYNTVQPIFWASGAAMFVRSTVFHAMGGFDTYFFAHQEEVDLCWRIQLAGYTIMACPSSVVYHVGGGTLPKGGRKIYLNFRNNLIMLVKNLTVGEKIWMLPLRIVLDWLFACKALLSKDISSCKAVLKAHAGVMHWLIFQRKNKVVKRKKLTFLQGVYRGSVVMDYFIRNKKLFSEIVKRN